MSSGSSVSPSKRNSSEAWQPEPAPSLAKRDGARAGGRTPAKNTAIARSRRSVQRDPHDKIALVLAGGGITGAVYEIGALRAMDDLLVGLSVNDFDIYVGTSAGALVNSLIANGFTPREVMQLIDNRHPELNGFGVRDAFRFNFEGAIRRLSDVPGTVWSIASSFVRNRGDVALADMLWEVARILPAGIFNGDALAGYLHRILEESGCPDSFDHLRSDLFIVASEMDSGARAVFGRGHVADVPVSRAVAASSAVPVLYRPVQVFDKDYLDGGLHGAASLDLAIEAGAKLVVCVNPMVPFDASRVRPGEHYIRQHGLQAVINQSVRTLLHSSLKYHIKNLSVKYPDVDIILIQPGLDDLKMFSHNPMKYSGRLAVAQHGFESVTMGLLGNINYYRSVLARHDVELHTDLLRAEMAALCEDCEDHFVIEELVDLSGSRSRLTSALGRLEVSLKRLEQALDHPVAQNGDRAARDTADAEAHLAALQPGD